MSYGFTVLQEGVEGGYQFALVQVEWKRWFRPTLVAEVKWRRSGTYFVVGGRVGRDIEHYLDRFMAQRSTMKPWRTRVAIPPARAL